MIFIVIERTLYLETIMNENIWPAIWSEEQKDDSHLAPEL
jgi:hypothetical protein